MAAHGKRPEERSENQRKRHYGKKSRATRTALRLKLAEEGAQKK